MSQAQRNKKGDKGTAKVAPTVRPSKSRAPFYGLLVLILAVGVAGIAYKVNSAPKPIVLTQNTALPAAEGYLLGKPDAPVTIMEFADFECPQCANFSLLTEPDVRTRIIDAGLANMRFYDFPMEDMHPNTLFASLAAACAADQGKFWPMHDLILAGQSNWEARATRNPKPELDKFAKAAGLDMGAFNACFDKRDNVARIQAHQALGASYMVNATPSFVIAGKLYPGNLSFDRIKQIVDQEIARISAAAGTKTTIADSTKPPAK
jgi:protein-disulfide isomerase